MARPELLEIVNEQDEVIGQETRDKIHTEGLLHREIHVWFITPDGSIVFQHRAKDKDTYPDLLDATVGGHVEIGQTYEQTAVKETKEETGVDIVMSDLHLLKKVHRRSIDSVTGKINYAFRVQYAYMYRGNIADLKIEKGKAIGFEAWPIEKIFVLSDNEKRLFIPAVYSPEFLALFRECMTLITTTISHEKKNQ
jgi:isopentenyldiphosphate isomerase